MGGKPSKGTPADKRLKGNNQEPVAEPTPTHPYPDMRKKPNKAVYTSASNRDKVVPRDPTKSHPASMKPKSKGA